MDEVRYGVLDRLDVKQYRYFCFRRDEATESIPEESGRAGGYREFATDEDIRDFGAEWAEELARAQKLADLKQAIVDAGLLRFEYTARWEAENKRLVDLDAFGKQVHADLLSSADDGFGTEAPEALDECAEEAAAMEPFIGERIERYAVGSRQPPLNDLTAFAQGDG